MCSLILLPALVHAIQSRQQLSEQGWSNIKWIYIFPYITEKLNWRWLAQMCQAAKCSSSVAVSWAPWRPQQHVWETPEIEQDRAQVFHLSQGTLSLSQSHQPYSCVSQLAFTLVPLRQVFSLACIPYNIAACCSRCTLNDSSLNPQNRSRSVSHSFQVRCDNAKESALVCLSSDNTGFVALVTIPARKPGHC